MWPSAAMSRHPLPKLSGKYFRIFHPVFFSNPVRPRSNTPGRAIKWSSTSPNIWKFRASLFRDRISNRHNRKVPRIPSSMGVPSRSKKCGGWRSVAWGGQWPHKPVHVLYKSPWPACPLTPAPVSIPIATSVTPLSQLLFLARCNKIAQWSNRGTWLSVPREIFLLFGLIGLGLYRQLTTFKKASLQSFWY